MSEIPDSNPYINVSNWPTYEAQGWRWARNLPEPKRVNKSTTNAIIDTYQRDYGVGKVTLGNAWNEQYLGPAGESGMVGLYVRDVEQQVRALHKDLDAISRGEKTI